MNTPPDRTGAYGAVPSKYDAFPGAAPVSFTDPAAKFYPKIILLAPPFNGKTTIGLHFPKVDLIDADNKSANALKIVKPDGWCRRPLVTPEGAPVQEGGWTNIDNAVTAACMNSDARTIMLDSMSPVDFHLRRHCALATPTSINPSTIGGLKFMSQAHWSVYEVLLRGLLMKLIAVPKIAIITVHVEIQKDELLGGTWQTLLLPGKSQTTVPQNFTDCWLITGTGDKDKWTSRIRTVPGGSPRCASLGTSLDLPHEFDFSWPLVEAALKKRGVL